MIPGYCPKCGESVYLCASPLPCPYCTKPLPTTRDGRAVEYVAPEPGQLVVVTVPRQRGADWFGRIGEQLKQTFPDNEILVVEEGTSLSVEEDTPSRAGLIAAIEKRQDFNTSGGPNWGPANSAKAKNALLISLLVDLDLMSEADAKSRFRARHLAYEQRTTEAVERYNDEHRAIDKAEGKT